MHNFSRCIDASVCKYGLLCCIESSSVMEIVILIELTQVQCDPELLTKPQEEIEDDDIDKSVLRYFYNFASSGRENNVCFRS